MDYGWKLRPFQDINLYINCGDQALSPEPQFYVIKLV